VRCHCSFCSLLVYEFVIMFTFALIVGTLPASLGSLTNMVQLLVNSNLLTGTSVAALT